MLKAIRQGMSVESNEPRAKVDVSIVVPTYCESENLPTLVEQVFAALDGIDAEMIIVDDNSPDETVQICQQLGKEYPVQLLVRQNERGLSSAVIHGMRQAQGAIVVVMDADLSHPPEKVPELVKALQEGDADFVIGSRYVDGGATDDDWGLFRWVNSKVATLLARPLSPASDPMAGFFALHRERFESADKLDPIGYKIGLELMVKAGCRNVREIPIHFRDRLHGESKLSLKEQINYLRHLRRLYDFKWGWRFRLLQFLAVGATGMVVDLAVCFALLRTFNFSLARALGIWAALSWNFLWHRNMTFAHAKHRPALVQYVLYCLSCAVGAGVNWGTSIGLSWGFEYFDQHKAVAAFLGIVAGTAFNFTLSSLVAFRGHATKASTVVGGCCLR